MVDTSLLNENQRKAVLADNQYLRIVAGAGSGKTRVLTMRIAHLIQDLDVYPNKILAITFTNKAANEMKERIRKMLGEDVKQPWISTIHSLCVRILREDIDVMGWPKSFTVMDTDDQKTILKEAYKEYGLDAQTYSYPSVIGYISNNKTEGVSVSEAMKMAGNFKEDVDKAKVYSFYLRRQEELFALDFDDLILRTVRLFDEHPEKLEKWQNRFSYIHVDEFQDIDKTQYRLIRMLAGNDNSIYVVGDPDQTIYTWRGADVDIIMNFNKDFPDAETIMLNENYRSTNAILSGANSVIKNNKHRLDKQLFTSRPGDELITHYNAVSDSYQAQWIAEKIVELHREGKKYSDIAILYRSNYLSRLLEKGMLDARIPYVIYGGTRFYDRQEVKDAICYLRMLSGGDDLAFQRIINRPKRGIGNKTLDTISTQARTKGISMYDVIRDEKLFSGKAQKSLDIFVMHIEHWRKLLIEDHTPIVKLFDQIMDKSGYRQALRDDHEDERLENIKAVAADIKQFMDDNPESTLDEYLQMVSLYGDREEAKQADAVQLMTVHAAKGLEFDTVFVSDMNDGIFPNERAMNDGIRGVEEERRLAYVAFTRARNKLFLTEAGGFSFMLQRVRTTSRFVKEIDEDFIEHIGSQAQQSARRFGEQPLSSMMSFGRSNSTSQPSQPSFATTPTINTSKPVAGKKPITRLKKGEQVVHTKFGEGVVLSCKDGIASIAFAYPHGVKSIVINNPSLSKKA